MSIQTHITIIGSATNTPDNINGIKDPSLTTLYDNRGIHPTGEVLRIMKDKVIKAVKITVLKLKQFF